MTTLSTTLFDFKDAVARQFVGRPTLRQVVSTQVLNLLLEKLPWLAYVTPALTDAEPLMLDSPVLGTRHYTTEPLVDRVLQALVADQPMNLEALDGRHHNLALAATHRFAGADSEFDTRRLSGVTDAFNQLLVDLPEHFCHAQVAYWQGQGNASNNRDKWLQWLLKMALLSNLPRQGLDTKAQACVRALIEGGIGQPAVFAVQANLIWDEQAVSLVQPGLLLVGEWDEEQVVLWYRPSSQVTAFASLDAFGLALRDTLALDYGFERLSWDRHGLEGNVFAQLTALLLTLMCEQITQLRLHGLDVAQMQVLFAQLSDPAQWLVAGYFDDDGLQAKLPLGLLGASASDSFAAQQALLGMALAQAQSEGGSALDGVQDLHTFARKRLREQLLADYPVEANYFPDDLLLSLASAQGIAGGAASGAGGGEPLVHRGEVTLTAFAIGNLSSLSTAVITGVRHRTGQLIMPWLSVDYLKGLVQRVDIGGQYPHYVATALGDLASRPQRTHYFAREWRQGLLFSALAAKLDGKVTEFGLQGVVDFCHGRQGQPSPSSVLMPLAFKRRPEASQSDGVQGMYLLICAQPSRVLLYRPLYAKDTLLEYPSLDAMLVAIRASPELQQSMVAWMDPAARPIYDHGGIGEPHISSIGIDPYNLPEKPAPAQLATLLWATGVDEKLYAANQELRIALADLQSTSTAESRWALLSRGAWLLFDVVSLALRGPVASVSWLVQSLSALDAELEALTQGDDFARQAATVDLIITAGMTLLHAHLPSAAASDPQPLPKAAAFKQLPAQDDRYQGLYVVPSQGKVTTPGPLPWPVPPLEGTAQIDFSWRGNQGFNDLPTQRRQALMAMRAKIALDGEQPQATGIYQVAGQDYISMLGEVFAVTATRDGIRVVDPAGGHGPYLVYQGGAWRVDTRLRLRGGMPKASLQTQFSRMLAQIDRLSHESNQAANLFQTALDEVQALQRKRAQLAALEATEQTRRQDAEAAGEGGFDRAASDHLMSRYQARLSEMDAQVKAKRHEVVATLEAVIALDRKQIAQLKVMLEPKYGRYRPHEMGDVLERQLKLLLQSTIRNADFALGELYLLADYSYISQRRRQFSGKYLHEMAEQYQQFRAELIPHIELNERILALHGELDVLLRDAPDTLDISVSTTPRSVAQLIKSRRFTTIDLRFQHALNLAEAALRLESKAMPRRLLRFQNGLMNPALNRASSAHGDSLMANLSASDRISILQEAWDEYTAAIVHSLHIEPQAGVLLDPVMLRRYRAQMILLKEDAGRRLVDAMAEQDGKPTASGRVPYPVTQQPQQVIRNRDGQLLIATQVEDQGQVVLQVRQSISDKILQVFERQGDAWVERVAKPASARAQPGPAVDVDAQVKALLLDHQEVLVAAQAYVLEDVSGGLLDRLLSDQVNVLETALASFAEQGAQSAATAPLSQALIALRAYRVEQLTALFSKTPYPTAKALRFLHEQRLIKVEYVRREVSANTSPFDEFKIMRLNAPGASKGRPLWAAHFHLPSQTANLADFTYAHLKRWSQRQMGRQFESVSGQRVHRGRLEQADVQGIIALN